MSAPVHSPTVLVVDDDAWMRSVLADLLPEEGYKVEEASDGASGIRRAKADRPDVVILDLAMPELSGVNVLRELKNDSGTNNIPVIIFSAYASQLPPDCTPRAEAIVEKPVDLTDLLDQIGACHTLLRVTDRRRSSMIPIWILSVPSPATARAKTLGGAESERLG